MKVWNLMMRACVSTLLLAGVVVTGCENGGGEKRWPSSGWVAPEWDGQPMAKKAPAPAPAPRATAAPIANKPVPAAQPAPSMAGDVMYLPTGDRASSALSLRCGMPREVTAGNNFTYDIEVCNLTSMALQNVMVTYSLDGARVVSADPAATGNGFAIGDLAPKACKVIKVTASAAGTGSVRGCMGATWNNSLCCSTTVVQPALKVVKSVTPADGTPCDTFTYKIDVTNTGTGVASNVKLADTLPANVTSDNKNALNWDLGSLAAGQTISRTFSAKAGKTGSFVNNANATADNNLSAKSNDVSITIKQPALQITKQCPANSRLGRPATFKITVKNTGDAPANATVVEDAVPAGATFVSATDGGTLQAGKIVWNVGTLAAGASRELGVTMNVSAGNINNVVMARATCADAVSANCNFSVTGSPDLGTLLTDDEGVVLIGDNQIYRYEVENQGQVDLTNTTVVLTLPDGVTFVSSTAPKAPNIAGNKLTFTGILGILKSGERRNFTVTLKSSVAGEKLIISETTCDQLKTPVRDDELTNFIER